MPKRTKDEAPRYTASKMVGNNDWFVRCRFHGEFNNDSGRCLECDDESIDYVDMEDIEW